MKCVFCTELAKLDRTIAENELAWAFLTNIPITPGHVLVVPRRCIASIAEMTDAERVAIYELAERIKGALRESFDAKGFNCAWNEGEVAGQSVPHFHLHVVPRTKGDTGVLEYDPRKFLYRTGSRAETPEEELQEVAKQIKGALQ